MTLAARSNIPISAGGSEDFVATFRHKLDKSLTGATIEFTLLPEGQPLTDVQWRSAGTPEYPSPGHVRAEVRIDAAAAGEGAPPGEYTVWLKLTAGDQTVIRDADVVTLT